MQRDFWDATENLKQNTAKQIQNTDPSTFTQMFTTRMRLQKQPNASMPSRGNEYGNYERFEKNTISESMDTGSTDTGEDTFMKNYNDMLRQLNTEEAQRLKDKESEFTQETINDESIANMSMMDQFLKVREGVVTEDEVKRRINEQNMQKDWENQNSNFRGRMSPMAKEQLYREYLKGATVKNLSLQYGILPQRVRAIVFQKHLFWEEVYPRMGESHMRLAIEKEAYYASNFPFVDYGCDLELMSELEKGVKMTKLIGDHKESDAQKPEDKKAVKSRETNEYLAKMRPRQYDKLPIKFVGKGPGGYMLYDIVHHRGHSSPHVSQSFADAVRHHGKPTEQMVNDRVMKRMKVGGPRFAV